MLAGSGGWPQALELAKASNVDQRIIRYIEKASVSGSGLSGPLATNTEITAYVESLALYSAATQIPFVPHISEAVARLSRLLALLSRINV
jgi:hypothetical protein